MHPVCRRVATKDGSEYFVCVKWKKDDSFDVRLTDGVRAWEAFDCVCPPNTRVGEDVWRENAQKALLQTSNPPRYTFDVEEKSSSSVDLLWMWSLDELDLKTKGVGRCSLYRCEAASALRGFLGLACDTVQALHTGFDALEKQRDCLDQDVADLKAKLESRTAEWEAKLEGLYVKMAQLLNEKSARIRKLEEAVEARKDIGREKSDVETDGVKSDDPYNAETEESDGGGGGATVIASETCTDNPQPSLSPNKPGGLKASEGLGVKRELGTPVRKSGQSGEGARNVTMFSSMLDEMIKDDEEDDQDDFMNAATQPLEECGDDAPGKDASLGDGKRVGEGAGLVDLGFNMSLGDSAIERAPKAKARPRIRKK